MRSRSQEARLVIDAIGELVTRYGFHIEQDGIAVDGESVTIDLTIKSNPPALGVNVGDRIQTKDKLS